MENNELLNIINSIELYKVNSSNVTYIGYNKDYKILKVVFKNNSKYAYFGIPLFMWEELKISNSIGSYISNNIAKYTDNFKYIKL